MNKLTEKWRVTGLLDGLINETTCDKLAGYLDTVATRLIKEKKIGRASCRERVCLYV